MSTTVHLPVDLLASVDRQARALAMSRNRYIIRVEELASARSDVDGGRALEELRDSVAASRTRKGPPAL